MNMLNVIANAFGVPLILGTEGKIEAIAVQMLKAADETVTNSNRVSAKEVITYLVELDGGKLDPVIGRYDIEDNERGKIAEGLNAVSEDRELQRQLLKTLLDKLVAHLENDPRDVGNTTP